MGSFLGPNWKDGPGANQEVALVDTAMGRLCYTSPGPLNDHCLLQSVAERGRGQFWETEMELAENASRNPNNPGSGDHTLGWSPPHSAPGHSSGVKRAAVKEAACREVLLSFTLTPTPLPRFPCRATTGSTTASRPGSSLSSLEGLGGWGLGPPKDPLSLQQGFLFLPRQACGRKEGSFWKLRGGG